MATFNKFQIFVQDLAHAVHNFSSDALEVALSNASNAPSASLDAVLTDITVIAYTNLSSRVITTSTSSQSGGVYSLVLNDLTLTASGGSVAAFQYVIIFNQGTTAKIDPLIGWFDYGSELTLADGESLTIDFGADGGSTGTLLTIT